MRKLSWLIVFVFVLLFQKVEAQCCNCEGGGCLEECCLPPNPDPVPIQGLPILIAAGLVYGINKLRKQK